MKKILHIAESFGSGVFSFLVDLINETDNDYDIIVAYGEREETPQNFKEYFSSNVKFVKIENFTRNIALNKDIKALKELKKVIKEVKPDIIHLHSSKAGVLGRLAMKGNKIKMFYNPHGFSFLKEDDSKLKRTIYWMIEKTMAIVNKKCTIIGCSKGEYEEAFKLNKNSICINNGINVDKLIEETKNLQQKEIDFKNLKICTVGRIGYQKNPYLFNNISKEFPNIRFTWVGDGDLRNELICDNIMITGWKTRKEVLEILNEQDIFLLTSLWEGLPISLLEAMYMKKICIVNDCIGNRDVIINEKNGYIAKTKADFNRYINRIINKQINYNDIKNTAKEDVINNYDIGIMISKYKKIY